MMKKKLAVSTTSAPNVTFTFSQLAEQFQQYVDCPFADFAILLDGKWGCGKSYFINKNLVNYLKDVKLIVVSLNGVQSLQELDTLILMSRYLPKDVATVAATIPQAISSTHVILRLTQTLLPSIFNPNPQRGTGLFGKLTGEGKKKEMKSKKDETDSPSELLVIDDLERHSKQLSVEDILGHLHERYVLKGTRILFLCDETEIRDRNQFSKCKEKYIRREYRFPELDAELLLDVIEARYRKYNKPHAEVTTIINDLIRLSKQYGVSNLRTICAIMDGYVELVERLDAPKFFKSIGPYLIEHMFPLYNERSNGNLSVKDLANCGDLDQLEMVGYSAILGKASGAAKNQNSANELTYPEQFAARYEGLPHRWSLRKPVFRFVIGNELDEKAFVESFADRLEAGDSTRRALETVFAFYEYDEKPLQRAIQTVLSGIDADRYSLGELVKLMLVFRQIKEHDYVSDASWSHVVLSKVLNSVRRQSKQAKAVAEANSLSMSWMSGEIEQSGASKEQLAVVDEIRKIAKRSKASEIDSKLDRLFTALKHHDTKGIWDNYPVGESETELLVRFVEAGYADRFAQLGTYGLRWLSQYVQNRLIHTELSSPVKSVVEAIDAIVESVRKSIEIQWVTKPKKARLVEFITVLKDAREHLANQPEMNNEPKSKQSDDSMFHRNSQ